MSSNVLYGDNAKVYLDKVSIDTPRLTIGDLSMYGLSDDLAIVYVDDIETQVTFFSTRQRYNAAWRNAKALACS